jgi:hypothetical protein
MITPQDVIFIAPDRSAFRLFRWTATCVERELSTVNLVSTVKERLTKVT